MLITRHPTSTQQPESITSGVVWTEVLARTAAPGAVVSRTHFPPRARTCWHEHPQGQVLIVEAGVDAAGDHAVWGEQVSDEQYDLLTADVDAEDPD